MRKDKGEKEREGREIRFGCQYFGSAVAGGTVVNTNTHTNTTRQYIFGTDGKEEVEAEVRK